MVEPDDLMLDHLRAMRGDQVWGVAYNADDVAFLKRYRISWP